jgi:hypothetical protein
VNCEFCCVRNCAEDDDVIEIQEFLRCKLLPFPFCVSAPKHYFRTKGYSNAYLIPPLKPRSLWTPAIIRRTMKQHSNNKNVKYNIHYDETLIVRSYLREKNPNSWHPESLFKDGDIRKPKHKLEARYGNQ